MLRGPLYEDGYPPQLSGHETFPLRYGWLKKAYDAVRKSEDQADNGEVFSGPDAIARFGVGKNMVSSMRHWAEAAGVVVVDSRANHAATTSLGRRLFDDHGLDPYMEDPSSSWLIHWRLAGRSKKTTWFWAFSHYPALTFEREGLAEAIGRLAKDRKWLRASYATIKNDVACFVRTYVAQSLAAKSNQRGRLGISLDGTWPDQADRTTRRLQIRPGAEAVLRSWSLLLRGDRLLERTLPQRQHPLP